MRVEVKAVEGRVARTAPDGEFIPHDEYVSVELTPYIQRLLNVHGDIVLKEKAETTKPVTPPVTKETK